MLFAQLAIHAALLHILAHSLAEEEEEVLEGLLEWPYQFGTSALLEYQLYY